MYVADHFAGLRIIDVSTPSSPVEVGFSSGTGEANDVDVVGIYAFVAAAGLQVIDVSNPFSPTP